MRRPVASQVAPAKVVLRDCIDPIGRQRVEPQRLGLVLHHAVALLVEIAESALRGMVTLRCTLDEQPELPCRGSHARNVRPSPYGGSVSTLGVERFALSPPSSTTGRCAGPEGRRGVDHSAYRPFRLPPHSAGRCTRSPWI